MNLSAAQADVDVALRELRAAVGSATYPFDLPSAGPARESASTLAAQLDDYLIPRVRRMDAPVLAVVGGSTGAGKSTLVNSLVRAPVSAAGVLRPTTRGPVLVCHPADGAWFGDRALLSGLARSNRPGEQVLQVVSAPLLRPGVALLDAPDIDSVVAANRALARELLAAADLWLFVTTAARYADAVPWEVLRGARDRGTVVAVVLDRVPPPVRAEVAADFDRMLCGQDFGDATRFVVPESTLDGHGLLTELEVAPIKQWLDAVASNPAQRRGVTRRTLLGAVAAASSRAETLAQAADDQTRAASAVAAIARETYGRAMSDVEAQVRVGSVLRGDVYLRWQELIATGELEHALRLAQAPERARAGVDPVALGVPLQAAIAGALAALIVEVNVAAAEATAARWRLEPAGRELLEADARLGRPWPGFADAAHDLVHGWQTWLRSRALSEAPATRTRTHSYGTASMVLLATIAAVAPPAEEIVARGPGPTMLRAVVDIPGARSLGDRARADLMVRVADLLAAEVDRRLATIGALGVEPGLAARLRDGSAHVGVARHLFTGMTEAA